MRSLPVFHDLRSFLAWIDLNGDLLRIAEPVAARQQMTAVQMKVLRDGGPALRFDQPVLDNGLIAQVPVVTNLFGTKARVAAGLGLTPIRCLNLARSLPRCARPRRLRGCATPCHDGRC